MSLNRFQLYFRNGFANLVTIWNSFVLIIIIERKFTRAENFRMVDIGINA